MTKMSARQLSHVLANQGTRTTVAPIWPYVAADEYPGLRCFGDQHRESLQVGAPTGRDPSAERTKRLATERAGSAESARLVAWLTANAESFPRTFMISDILAMITPDVFDATSTPHRRQLMLSRALQRAGVRLINKQTKAGVWCRESDYAKVTKVTNGRQTLLEVPASLRPIRARRTALQKEWKDRRRGRTHPVVDTLAAIAAPDAAPDAVYAQPVRRTIAPRQSHRSTLLPAEFRRRWS